MPPMQQNSFTYDDLISCAKGEMFGPGNPQLPMPPMLMCDRIIDINDSGGVHAKGQIISEFDLNPDLWFFPCHFVGDPVMPGCLGMDALWQLVGFFLGWAGGEGAAARAPEHFGSPRSTAGPTTPIWTRRAAFCGRSSRNMARACPGPT